MDIHTIKELAALMRNTPLSIIDIEENGVHIHLESPVVKTEHAAAALPIMASQPETISDPGVDFNMVSTIKAPLVGVFSSQYDASPCPCRWWRVGTHAPLLPEQRRSCQAP